MKKMQSWTLPELVPRFGIRSMFRVLGIYNIAVTNSSVKATFFFM